MMVMMMVMVMVMIMVMMMVMMMVMLGAPELCSRIPPHFVRRSRSFDFGRSRSYCKDQGSACPKTDVRMILPHLIFSVIVEISPCL